MQLHIIYISGKMSGLPDLNKAKFHAARVLLENIYSKGRDLKVINPHEIDHSCHDGSYSGFMCEDLKWVIPAKEIAVLDDWQKSQGAIVEVLLADFLGKPIYPVYQIEVGKRIKITTALKIKLLLKLLLKSF